MSVINHVLKGLENKPSSFTPLQAGAANRPEKRQGWNAQILFYSLMLLLMLVIALYLLIHRSQPVYNGVDVVEPSLPVVELPAPPLQAVDSVSELGLLPVPAVTGLQLKEATDYLELSLRLAKDASSFLKLSGKNRYVFQISNAPKNIIIPVIHENQWLQNMTLNVLEQGVEIRFDTVDGVLVETRHKQQGDDYFWVIRLKRPPVLQPKDEPAVVSDTTPVSAEKTIADSVDEIAASESIGKPLIAPAPEVKLDIKPIKAGPSDSDLLFRAQSQMQAGDLSAAEGELRQLLDGRLDKKARLSLLSLYQRQQKEAELSRLLAQSLALYPSEEGFTLLDAQRLYARQEYSAVIARYRQESNSSDLMNMVAAACQASQQHEQAVEYYKKSLTLNPQQPRAWISLGISQEQMTQFDQALQSYRMAQRSGSSNQRLQEFMRDRINQLSNTVTE